MQKVKCAIIGSGNIGTDLMMKITRWSEQLEIAAFIGIDPASDGLARAERFGVKTSAGGVEGFIEMPEFADIKIIFDATSAQAHHHNFSLLKKFTDKKVIDLTPAAIGPYVIPSVNISDSLSEQNVNMVTCGGQATIPVIAAVSQVAKVYYGEIVASIASRSAGPGTRANIDEFTETTSLAIEKVGGAEKGKAIIILNPAEPPLVMRDTVFTLSAQADKEAIRESIHRMIDEVKKYVPGYKLQHEVQFEDIGPDHPIFIEGLGNRHGLKTMVLLQVTGAGHYLPAYAGNLDIMTSAAMRTGEMAAIHLQSTPVAP